MPTSCQAQGARIQKTRFPIAQFFHTPSVCLTTGAFPSVVQCTVQQHNQTFLEWRVSGSRDTELIQMQSQHKSYVQSHISQLP